MKIRVQLEDGSSAILELQGTWVVIEGKYLTRIRDFDGFEHFFTHDGYYDGWGTGHAPTSASIAESLLQSIEEKRKIEG